MGIINRRTGFGQIHFATLAEHSIADTGHCVGAAETRVDRMKFQFGRYFLFNQSSRNRFFHFAFENRFGVFLKLGWNSLTLHPSREKRTEFIRIRIRIKKCLHQCCLKRTNVDQA